MLRGIWHEVVDRLFGDRPKEKLSPEERRELFRKILEAQQQFFTQLEPLFSSSFKNGQDLLKVAKSFQDEPTFLHVPTLSNIGVRGWSNPGSDIYHTTYFSKDHHNPDLRFTNPTTRLSYQGEVFQSVFERTTNLILAISLEARVFSDNINIGSQQLIVLSLPKNESQTGNQNYWQEALRKRDLDVDDKSLKIQISREHRVILTCEIQGDTYDFYELFQYSTDRRVLVCLKEKSPHPSTKRGHPIRPDVILPALVRA